MHIGGLCCAGALELMPVHSARNLPRTLAAAAEAGWQVLGATSALAGSRARRVLSSYLYKPSTHLVSALLPQSCRVCVCLAGGLRACLGLGFHETICFHDLQGR